MSERTAVILQPSYLPWLGCFAQLHQCDVFVFYDNVQFDKNGWRNRNRIKTSQGEQWLTVPALTSGRSQSLIREVEINNKLKWRKKHLASLRQNYAKAPFFADYFPLLEEVYEREWTQLMDLNIHLFQSLSRAMGLEREFVLASDLDAQGDQTGRLVEICQKVGATRFYEGAAGKDYMDASQFERAGITLEYQDYHHPTYPQLHGPFIPYLSIVDLLFNCGPKSLEILAQ